MFLCAESFGRSTFHFCRNFPTFFSRILFTSQCTHVHNSVLNSATLFISPAPLTHIVVFMKHVFHTTTCITTCIAQWGRSPIARGLLQDAAGCSNTRCNTPRQILDDLAPGLVFYSCIQNCTYLFRLLASIVPPI